MWKFKEVSREYNGRNCKWQIGYQLIQDLYKEIRILIDSQIMNNSILDNIFAIYNSSWSHVRVINLSRNNKHGYPQL